MVEEKNLRAESRIQSRHMLSVASTREESHRAELVPQLHTADELSMPYTLSTNGGSSPSAVEAGYYLETRLEAAGKQPTQRVCAIPSPSRSLFPFVTREGRTFRRTFYTTDKCY